MRLKEKLVYLQDNHFSEWIKTRQIVDEEVSQEHPMWCVCGRLCTGLHESNCRRFQNKVNSRTVKKLTHLIKV